VARHSFKFGTWIYGHAEADRIKGPRFHRWLPDGERDALHLQTEEPTATLRAWFRRLGKMDRSLIQFAQESTFDPSVISRQGVLDAGPLYGQLDLEIADEEISSLRTRSSEGERVAKRLLRLIEPPVSRLISILRVQYGQYWLMPDLKWDSRTRSLQNAISGLHLEWRNPETDKWERIVVGENALNMTASVAGRVYYDGFVTAQDWRGLESLVNSGREPSAAVVQIGATHEALDQDDYRLALIEGVTACEHCINECIRPKDAVLATAIQSFWGLPLPAQLVTVVSARGQEIDPKDVASALNTIDLRNKIVHEGWRPTRDNHQEIHKAVDGLLRVLKALLAPLPIKFASAGGQNTVFQNEADWDDPSKI
jgi:hypothetical protein